MAITTIKLLCTSAVASSLAATLALAQAAPIEFRVVPTDRNPSSCQQWDAALSRVHTFTQTGNTASIRSAGGVTSNMTLVSPNVFATSFSLGGTTLNVMADAASSPKSLEVTNPRIGCRWSAVAP
jgi:hypothetical protein